jgi:uncharacterized protein YciI
MRWAAWHEYVADPDRVQAARPAHRAYLTQLLDAGKLAFAGPFEDGCGALIVYECESREAAEGLIAADPFRAAGVFHRHTLKPWKQVFTAEQPRQAP